MATPSLSLFLLLRVRALCACWRLGARGSSRGFAAIGTADFPFSRLGKFGISQKGSKVSLQNVPDGRRPMKVMDGGCAQTFQF